MDQAIRNKLRGVVTHCRKLLEDSVSQELQGKFGIYATAKKDAVQIDDDARMTHLSSEERGARKDILDHFEHIRARSLKPKDALDQLIREIAYTHLNRLCAYKMMEARQVYVGDQRFREAVSRGANSNGVKFYLADHPEDERLYTTGKQDVAYRHFLDWLGGLLSEEIGVLFSPNDPANRVYPTQKVLDQVLALLNDAALADIWTQDETIGWVYQYFTPKELRDQARKDSAAPRTSYELAFRNQFFTPRYVVEFLTDNTLGRVWYEMRKGDTKLKSDCRYMVRRPMEIFLAEDEAGPFPSLRQGQGGDEELAQEERLRQPVHIPHRSKKDPRELKILDPACGSGHFLLYCFDLLLTIYDEAYTDPNLGPPLKKDYPSLGEFKKAIPSLILSHNLHGIDIDLRATQIAALALWLRCQRTYQEMGLRRERPNITRSNVVCAEPMPGEKGLLDEFLKTLREDRLEALIRRVMHIPEGGRVRATRSMADSLCELVRLVWDKMQLAGEAGSLLRIEEELQEAIRKGQGEWEEKQPLFHFTEFSLREESKESYLRFVPGGGLSFWDRAEGLVMAALRDFATYGGNGKRLQRRLFADDAVQGFAFVDLCRKRFDVVLMNPPFGYSTLAARVYLEGVADEKRPNLAALFIGRWLSRLEDGSLGALTTRNLYLLTSYTHWRTTLLNNGTGVWCLADLGKNVLDDAMVEAVAAVMVPERNALPSSFIDLLDSSSKQKNLAEAIHSLWKATPASCLHYTDVSSFKDVPGRAFCYWVSERVCRSFRELPTFASEHYEGWVGLQTGDDTRWLRLWWEVPEYSHSRERHGNAATSWVPHAKGGDFKRYYSDLHLVVEWTDNGLPLKSWKQAEVVAGRITKNNSKCWNESNYFRAGLTWTQRSQIGLGVRALPRGAIIGVKGPGAYGMSEENDLLLLGILNSQAFRGLVSLHTAFGSYYPGVIQKTPLPRLTPGDAARIRECVVDIIIAEQVCDAKNEVSHLFVRPLLCPTLTDGITTLERANAETTKRIKELQGEIDRLVSGAYGFTPAEEAGLFRRVIEDDTEAEPETTDEEDEPQAGSDARAYCLSVISYLIGCDFGRWDARHGAGGLETPALPSPFEPLPDRSPGMLLRERQSARQTGSYLLRINREGILVDDTDHVDDVVRRAREVLELIWKHRADAIEKEFCEIVGAKELRDYFRKSGKGGFWDDHVIRYSKGRRKGPIYWLLQSSKKNYALWAYYHRLDKDFLFKALVNYVEPKIQREINRLDEMRQQKQASGSGKGVKKLDKDIERHEDLISELRDFEDKLRRAANMHLIPDLNDGVVLNIAPLHELVPWKEAKSYWEELLEGKYEWSSIGKQLRQKRVVK
jgi:hypothetical protein